MKSPVIRLVAMLLLRSACGTVGLGQQTAETPTIRVETHEVILPVEVVEETKDPKGLLTGPDGKQWHVYLAHSNDVQGLSEKSFHILEDDSEQEIRHFSIEKFASWGVSDNKGQHTAYSCTPRSIWRGQDKQKAESDKPWQIHTYLVTYIPPPTLQGTCHQLVVKVDQKHATIFAPNQYCNTKDPLSDPLNGTDLGDKLLASTNSQGTGNLPLSVQTNAFTGSTLDSYRVNVSARIPAELLTRKWNGARLETSIAILGLVRDDSDALVTRFSDVACLPTQLEGGYNGPLPPSEKEVPAVISEIRKYLEDAAIPVAYETQLELRPGTYRLELVITDGRSFGRVTTFMTVDDLSRKPLSISGIALCKRYHKPAPDERGPTRAPQYVPLTFDGMEFTPADDTRFKKGEKLFAYLEIYGSDMEMAGTKIYLEMKVSDEKTNQLMIGTGVRPVDSTVSSEKRAIPVVWDMDVSKLPQGAYRLEVQASDSAGHKTPWRVASFVVE
jgi:hypothetical protein